MKTLRRLLSCAALFILGSLSSLHCADVVAGALRERLSMDFGWRFHLGNEWGIAQNLAKAGTGFGPASVYFSDASWRSVDLPHDWAVELPFDAKAEMSHGFKALGEGFPNNSVAWYRRAFDVSANDAGKRIWLEFDGVYRDCTVFLNGWFVAHHASGYNGFRVDVTDVLNFGGSNALAVLVDATQTEGWFYEGAGIYRHVWLVKTAPVAIAPDSVFVYASFPDTVPTGTATIHLETQALNTSAANAKVEATWEIISPAGKAVPKAQTSATALAGRSTELKQTATVEQPELWSPETPRLYQLVTTLRDEKGRTIDRVSTPFGIRTVGFDAEKGFLLNGKPYVLKGTCNHQDHAGVGVALPDRLQAFRIEKLKAMGSNAYRTAHNAPTPELLDACDRLGMLVMDENRLLGSDPQHLKWFEELIRRDRNHPSVVIWSLANEEFTAAETAQGGRVAVTMQRAAKLLDPTRPITYNAPVGNVFTGINEVIEVRGWSYRIGEKNMDAYHAEHPQQPNVGSEQGSTVTTRGIYTTDPERGYMSAYDDNQTSWSNTAEQWLTFFSTRPWLSGGFVWTGFDYRGEPTPYAWPCINSHFGIFDTCGFPKDNFWYYQSWWTDQPVLHLLPHWNWAGREGQPIDVRALSNCDEVEVFLNGRSQGRQAIKLSSKVSWKIPYEAGVISAKGFKGGKLVAETKVETTGPAAAVHLAADRSEVAADGRDVSVITVSIGDAQGRVSPTAGNRVTFDLEGPGRILGVGNGDPSCHEPDVFVSGPGLRSRAISGWRWNKIPDAYAKSIPETAPEFDDSAWTAVDVQSASGPVKAGEAGVFRARFTVTAADLAGPGVELRFGKIAGEGMIFINGENVGKSNNSRSPAVVDVKKHLRVGENVVAVALAVYDPLGGLNEGAELRLVTAPPPVQWSRSVFNGLAQIIVQSTREPGVIKLTARAEGLKPATTEIRTARRDDSVALVP